MWGANFTYFLEVNKNVFLIFERLQVVGSDGGDGGGGGGGGSSDDSSNNRLMMIAAKALG
jgi:uncharacterized membrane protein YgcG